jgi:hypothetical protein
MTYQQAKEECREDVLLSLRDGALLLNEVKFLIQYFKDTEQYECIQGAMEAYNEYKEELDGIGDRIS